MGACFDLPSKDEFEALEREVRFFDSGRGFNIAYHEYGDPKGTPLFVHHGTGSHVHVSLLHKPASRLGFRIVAPDRPGVSLSEFRPSWTPLEYAADVGALAEHIGIETFGLLGISGAGRLVRLGLRHTGASALRGGLRLRRARLSRSEMLKLLGSMDVSTRTRATLPLALFQAPSPCWLTPIFMKSPKSFAKLFASSLCAPDSSLRAPIVQYLSCAIPGVFARFRKARLPTQTVTNWGRAFGMPSCRDTSGSKIFHPLQVPILSEKAQGTPA
jgi:pimeloyl-ACP methyl ester carboxylesterase